MTKILNRPSQDRSREKLGRLLAAGAQLFGERGFDGTRISDVAELGGCSVGVLYQRFVDKDAFFAAVRSQWIEQTAARFDQHFEAIPNTASGLEVLTRFVDDTVTHFREHVGLISAFLIYEVTHPEFSAAMLKLAHSVADRLAARLLEHGLASGQPDPGLSARFALEVLQATLVYLVLHSAEAPLGLDDPRLPRQLERMLGAYLGVAG